MKQIIDPPTMGQIPEWRKIGDRLINRTERLRKLTEWQLQQLNIQPHWY
jgi:hypothetical protein